MMLRAVVVVLALANLGVYAWTHGWLGAAGATGDREPERLARQVTPDAVRVLPAAGRAPNASGADRLACLEIGPFSPAQSTAAEAALSEAMPPERWTVQRTDTPPVWTVYMGKFPNREILARKLEELESLRVPFREVTAPEELVPGISLGRFDDRAAAEKALGEFTQRGVRTARVAQLLPASAAVVLRVDRVEPALQSQLLALRDAALLGKGFTPCVAPTAAR